MKFFNSIQTDQKEKEKDLVLCCYLHRIRKISSTFTSEIKNEINNMKRVLLILLQIRELQSF
jgi:hypothetical protein